jgi:hypothetical protein
MIPLLMLAMLQTSSRQSPQLRENLPRVEKLTAVEDAEVKRLKKALDDAEERIAKAHGVVTQDPNKSCHDLQSAGYAIACVGVGSADQWKFSNGYILINLPITYMELRP